MITHLFLLSLALLAPVSLATVESQSSIKLDQLFNTYVLLASLKSVSIEAFGFTPYISYSLFDGCTDSTNLNTFNCTP